MGVPAVLVVDDDVVAREYITLLLREKGYLVRSCSNGLEAILAIESEPPQLMITDLRMPEMDGLELLQHVKGRWPDLSVILLTVVGDVAMVVEAIKLGASNYLVKPATPSAIIGAVNRSLASSVSHSFLPSRIPEILGNSRTMMEVRRWVTIAASSDVNILITGETGTGKELVARAIHRYSSLGIGPFVAHNCAATPNEIFESQFFGHRRGAFTGAHQDHIGLMEQAKGGVLFLDELDALNLHNQAKLLRVLDDGQIRPVGSTQVRSISVRYLTATNKDPQQLIADGALREDLYYRLRGLEIAMPPLRNRRGDIALLAHHFLGPENGTFTPEALEALCAFSWPGNVRQLRNVIRSAKALAGKARIDLRHLALGRPANGRIEDSKPAIENPHTIHPLPLRDLERQAILEALEFCRGNLSYTARILGIDRSTLRRRLQEFKKSR